VKQNLKFSIKTIFIFLTIIALISTILVTIVLSKNSKNELIFSESKKYFEQSIRLSQTIFDYELEKIFSVVNSISFSASDIKRIRNNDIESLENSLNKTIPKSLHFTAILPFKSQQSALGGFFLYDINPLVEALQKIQVSTSKSSLIKIDSNGKELVFIVVTKGIVDEKNGEIVGIFAGGIELNTNIKFIQDIKNSSKVDDVTLLYDNIEILKDNPNGSSMDFLKGFNLLT
jgi:hypothetical protein